MKNFSVLLLLFFCCACSTPEPILFQGTAMTIDYRVLVGHELTLAEKHNIQAIIDTTFAEVDQIYNKWNPSSELSHLNRLPAHQTHILSPQLEHFLQRTHQIVEWTEGRFDPTIEPVQAIWTEALQAGYEPAPEVLEEILPAVGWRNIHIKDGVFYKDFANTQLDLGGIAKGYCVDLLVERLQKIGYQNLLIDWGCDLRTMGKHPTGRAWQIGIRNVDPNSTETIVDKIEANSVAVAGSGDYLQYWQIQKEGQTVTYCHIIDPFLYKPLQVRADSIAGTNVVALNCFLADALATAFMIFPTRVEAEMWAQMHKEQLSPFELTILTRAQAPSVESMQN